MLCDEVMHVIFMDDVEFKCGDKSNIVYYDIGLSESIFLSHTGNP